MYKFRDINSASENAVMPSEALKINGEFIENLIAGYRTLHVRGREALSPEIDYYETGVRDGSTLKYKRYPARYIVVTYQLSAPSNKAFRDAFNALGGILDVQDAELIFNDEPDKFYTGTPSLIGEIEPGHNSVIGEIEFFCADPFKYSVEEYEVEPTQGDGAAFVVNYNGTYKAFPELEASFYSEDEAMGETESALTGNGDCGFVAFFNESHNIIQLGDADESDGESFPKSQTLVNKNFNVYNAYGTAAKKYWKAGGVHTSSITQDGTAGLKQPNPQSDPDTYYMTATKYTSATGGLVTAGAHGPCITRIIPADEAGETGAANFTFSWRQKICIGNGKNDTNQRGGLQAILSTESGKILAGVSVYKPATGKKGKMRFFVNAATKQTIDIDLSYYNKYFGTYQYDKNGKVKKKSVRACYIKKQGSTISFDIGGIKKTWKNSAWANLKATQITFTFFGYDAKPTLDYNGVYLAKFVKNNCDTWRDIPNKFSAGDVVVADCKAGEVFLNDRPAPELGALGNDWEDFCLQAGANQIGIAYSDWVDDAYAPAFKLRYREVFL